MNSGRETKMTIGTGIAIAGAWIFVAAGFTSKNTTEAGKWISLFVGVVVTYFLV